METRVINHFWAELSNLFVIFLTLTIGVLAKLTLTQFSELIGLSILLFGVVGFGFVGIALHLKYYFNFEKDRRVDLLSDRLIVKQKSKPDIILLKKDILRLTLCDRLKSVGSNFAMTLMDGFYYVEISTFPGDPIVLTSLLDIKLKHKLALWWGAELQHRYQFFPFPPRSF